MPHQHNPKRPKVLLITRNLPPLVGGMERLNWHMADELSRYADVKIVGPGGAATITPKNTTVREAPLKPLPLFLLIAFCKALWLAWRWRPTHIIAGSGLTAPITWFISKLIGANSCVYLHGFDITAPSRVYQRFWAPVFRKIDSVIVNSTPTKQLALVAGVPEHNIHLIFPGASLPKACQPAVAINTFKKQQGLENKKILLSVGRLTTRKGLCEFIENSLPSIVNEEPSAVLLIVGETPKNSLGASIQTEGAIIAQAQKSKVSKHVKFLGVITDQTLLSTVYEASDVHVFPVRHIPKDPEGFGMVAIEAAAHGLPTVAFATGGVVDAVADGQSGYLIDANNYLGFSQFVVQLLRHPLPSGPIKTFAKRFSWNNFGLSIRKALTLG